MKTFMQFVESMLRKPQKLWFWISKKTPEQIVKISKFVFRGKPFIKPVVEDDKCILYCYDIPGDASEYVINELVGSKKFIGKFDSDHPLYDEEKVIRMSRYQEAICRFGFWMIFSYPENVSYGNWSIARMNNLKARMPLHIAEREAAKSSGYTSYIPTQPYGKNIRRNSYIENLIDEHGFSEKEATNTIDAEYPQLKDIAAIVPPSEEVKEQGLKKFNQKINDLISTLKFMSPRERQNYLNDPQNVEKS